MGADKRENPGCLGSILLLFGVGTDAPPSEPEFPYRRRDDFLSPAELSFYRALNSAVGDRYTICPKVNLADIFFVVKPNENQGARGRISQKHVDFLLCDRQSMRPLAGIELDDSSHARTDRQDRDALVNSVFAAAGLPLVRIPSSASYSPTEIALKVANHVGSGNEAQVPPVALATDDAVPQCPKCDIPMVLRTASKGEQAGRQFFGCSNYPRCREVKPVG